jgi:hypothetical protein
MLVVCSNLLHKTFFDNKRDSAKRMFAELVDGKTQHVINLRADDGGVFEVWLQLDHSEHGGRLNFGGFKTHLGLLLQQIKERLDAGENANVFDSEAGDEKLFHIPALLVDKGVPNVMVLGLAPGVPGRVTMKLMYLDPAQFVRSAGEQSV